MLHSICQTCGTQFSQSAAPSDHCPICEDERQYIGWSGQQWTTQDALARTHHTEVRQMEPQLVGIGTQPSFAIGQRALLVQCVGGNVLWDCISLLDEATIAVVKALSRRERWRFALSTAQ